MDRTVIAPWKAEEKEQSEILHKKLMGLSLLYPMSEEMTKLLAWDMFLKPNPPAFFQVVHYLFRILDPVECKRRFYWPITDKKGEASFRASTVDYLKHLNEKHHLNWNNIKSYLVVMPGGMKFINFLLDLVGFVVLELTKQREKALTIEMDIESLKDLTVHSMSRQNFFMKEYVSAYMEELKQTTTKLRQETHKIKHLFKEISIKTGVEESLLLDDQFLEDFSSYNRLKCQEKLTLPAERLQKLDAPLCLLKEAMDQFLAKQAEHNQNKETADNTLRNIQKLFGTGIVSGTATGKGVRINALLTAFHGISDTIAEQLDANDHYNESNEFLTTDLQALRTKVQQIELQVNDIQKNLNIRSKEHSSNISGNGSHTQTLPVPALSTPMRPTLNSRAQTGGDASLLMKFVSTPPIKPEMSTGVRSVHVRLPLQDDFNAKQFENTCNNMLAPPRSARKLRAPQEQLSELNNTLNRSKIVDPMQLLRTINKKSAKAKANTQVNLSTLGSKWKQMQATFGFDDATPAVVPISPKSNVANPNAFSPFTPLNCNERTRIERLSETSNSSLYAKKSVALMKVLDTSLNVKNLSTSPSGRLDALVPVPLTEDQKTMPRLLLNDQTLNSSPQDKENETKTLPIKFDLHLTQYGNDEDLQNTSDSVLNDIII